MAGGDSDSIFSNLPTRRMKGRVAATPRPDQPLTPAVQSLRRQEYAQPGPDPSYADQLAQWLYSRLPAGMSSENRQGVANLMQTGANVYNDWTPTGAFESGIRSGTQGDAAGYVAGMLAAAPFAGGNAKIAGKTAEEIAASAVESAGRRGARTAAETAARTATEAAPTAPILTGRVRAAAEETAPRTATEAATGRRTMADVPEIRTLPVEQGIEAARGDPHLIPGGGSSPGYYIGGPSAIQSPEDLARMRERLDAQIKAGLPGADWYDRERRGLARTTGNDPAFNDFLAKMHGSWSQGVNPESETAFVTKEALSAIAGSPERAMYENQHNAFLAALDANNPNLMQTGKKTDEYAQHLNPQQPAFAPTATGVNDFRMGQEMGFRNADAEERAGEFSLGPTQHKYMDYETAQATARANAANLGGRRNWTGEQIQASPWTVQKAHALMTQRPGLSFEDAFAEANKTPSDFDAKHAMNITYEQQPAVMLAKTGHMPRAASMTDQQKLDYANDPGASWASAPSFGLETGELPRDVIYGQGRVPGTGMGLPTLPTTTGTGLFKNAEGGIEHNPMFVARPLTPFHAAASLPADIAKGIKEAREAKGIPATGPFALFHGDDQVFPLGQRTGAKDIKAAIEKGGPLDPSKPLTLTGNMKDLGTWEGFDPQGTTTIAGTPAGDKVMPGYAKDFFTTAEEARAYFGAQEGVGGHANWMKPTTGGTTGYFTPMGINATPEEMDRLAQAGAPEMPHVTSSAGGVTVTNFDKTPKLTSKSRDALQQRLHAAMPEGASEKSYPVRTDTIYAGPAWGDVGSGTATDQLLAHMSQRPELWDYLNQNRDIGRVAGGQARRDQAFSSIAGDQRDDIFNARTVASADPEYAGQGWADRLQKYRDLIKSGGTLPKSIAVGGVGVSLYPTAGFPATTPQQPGTTLNSPPPDWQRQMQDQRFYGF